MVIFSRFIDKLLKVSKMPHSQSASPRRPQNATRPKVGVALGCGGARTVAEVGALARLIELGIPIDCISGSSMSSLIAAIYAAGNFDYLHDYFKKANWWTLLKFLIEFRLPLMGFVHGKALMRFIRNPKALGHLTFDALKIPCRLVATDLFAETKHVISSGDVGYGVRKSMALPGFLTPIYEDGHWIIDGGIADPFPVDLCHEMGADIVIGIDVNLRRPTAHEQTPKRRPGFWQIAVQAIRLFENKVTRQNLRIHKPDVMIQPRVGHITAVNFKFIPETLQEGVDAVNRTLPKLKRIFPDLASLTPCLESQ